MCMYVYAASTVATLGGRAYEWRVKRIKDKLEAEKNYRMDASMYEHIDG